MSIGMFHLLSYSMYLDKIRYLGEPSLRFIGGFLFWLVFANRTPTKLKFEVTWKHPVEQHFVPCAEL
jgi:hypothetical protein